ncbi:thioredoxin family protein [Alkalihalobacterium elongatum]|uniref:thioredoxin family protein n=1 Tax=Alkalihalobacterium elongatum TaxID=2675466 RepID=UPI001C1F52C3|nr:thioredoxin family protein [Alkalihalobacterium elongatum]
MIEITSLDMVEEFIKENQFSFIYISRTNCGVCHALLPQVKELLQEFPLIELCYINADHIEEVAGRFSIFTVPALLFYIDGKEYIREARFVHMDALKEKVAKLYEIQTSEE